MKLVPLTPAERTAKRAARLAKPGRHQARTQLIEHQHHRRRLEDEIAAVGKRQRTHGLDAKSVSDLRKVRATLDTLNVTIFQHRQKMRGE